jgi:hypothetical protein
VWPPPQAAAATSRTNTILFTTGGLLRDQSGRPRLITTATACSRRATERSLVDGTRARYRARRRQRGGQGPNACPMSPQQLRTLAHEPLRLADWVGRLRRYDGHKPVRRRDSGCSSDEQELLRPGPLAGPFQVSRLDMRSKHNRSIPR